MKKGQAAMEFLMTYGWAILVVIAAIAALAYFGVLDPARLLPERCQFPAGMDCVDKASIQTTMITIALRNNLAFPITIGDIAESTASCAGAEEIEIGPAGGCYVAIAGQTVANNEVFRVRFNCAGLVPGEKFDGRITVTYTNSESGLTNTAVGDVRGRVA